MILRRIAGKEKQSLEVFGRNLNQSGFIQELKSVISEFSAYKVTSEVLEGVLPTLEKRPALQKKLRDIEKVYTSFYKELGEEYLTAEELLGVLSRLVPQSEKIRGSIIILDGFTGFMKKSSIVMPSSGDLYSITLCPRKIVPISF